MQERLLRFWQKYEIKPTHDASIAAMVPLQSERLLRYEASLERSIDRTLVQRAPPADASGPTGPFNIESRTGALARTRPGRKKRRHGKSGLPKGRWPVPRE